MSDIWLRLRGNENDINAWKIVLMHCRKRNINEVRIIYEKALQLFPTYSKIWSDYIFHELSAENMNNCQQLFARCLKKIPNLEIWRLYIIYVKHLNKSKPDEEKIISESYEFTLDNIGNDVNSIVIWLEYIHYQKERKLSTSFSYNDRINVVRRAYHRVLQLPLLGLESAWKDYCNFENEININLAGKFIDELSKSYTLMKSISKEIESYTKMLDKNQNPLPYDNNIKHRKLLDQWFDYIAYEETNPIAYENKSLLISRIILCYEQAILIFPCYPEIWFGYINFLSSTIETLSENSDNKETIESTKDLLRKIFERITQIYFPDSKIFYLAWIKFEEEFGTPKDVHQVYKQCLDSSISDLTLIYVHYILFCLKFDGLNVARACFKEARNNPKCNYHVYFIAATIEIQSSPEISLKILDLGLKKYQDCVEYIEMYIDFFDKNSRIFDYRSSFEKLLSLNCVNKNPTLAERISKIYLQNDSMFGGMTNYRNLFKRLTVLKSSVKQSNTNNPDKYAKEIFEDYINLMNLNDEFNIPLQDLDETTSYYMPDTSQMLPYLPQKIDSIYTTSLSPVPGGQLKLPLALEKILVELPDTKLYKGPFIIVDLLLDHLNSIKLPDVLMENLSSSTKNDKIDEGTNYVVKHTAQNKNKMNITNKFTKDSASNRGYNDIYFKRKQIKELI